ncbi:MAG: UDP-N-acetyl-D-glucosamine dehydrogenase [Proteobacteria bacterium]|nr:MAG: UDP-N-acetyl-D-glucosamine dehydrogenase [Pseudomonadota bacterium]
MEEFLKRVADKSAQIVVIGAGYVGLPFAVESAEAGFETIAYDLSKEKVESVNAGKSYIGDIPDERLSKLVEAGKLRATTESIIMRSADAIIICVPTPLNKTKDPDVSMIMTATEAILGHLRRGQLIILESTVYPGFTREALAEQLERTGLKVGRDIYLAFSPERVDPGNETYQTKNTPKVLGGMTESCNRCAIALYEHFIDHLVPVSSCDVAEMAKLLENTFRSINIGLVNELALMCQKLGIEVWEVIDAAATKPFGFMPFYPGPGLGGHCIPVDPHYLSWKLKTLHYNARFIELAGEVNRGMPEVVVQRIADALNDAVKSVKDSKVLVLGVAYKADIDDMRESPAIDVIELLRRRGAKVSYHDPHVPSMVAGDETYECVPLENVSDYDLVAILTDHSAFDYLPICQEAQLVFDTRNATKAIRADFRNKVVVL